MFRRFSKSNNNEPTNNSLPAQADFLQNHAAKNNNKSRRDFYTKASSILKSIENGAKTTDTLDAAISVLGKMKDYKFEPTGGILTACVPSAPKIDENVQANLDKVIKNLEIMKSDIARQKIGSANAGATAGALEGNKDLEDLQNNIKELDTLNKIIEKTHSDDNLQANVTEIIEHKIRPLCETMMKQLEDMHDKIDFSTEDEELHNVKSLAENMKKTEGDLNKKKWLQDIIDCVNMKKFLELDADINRERLTYEERACKVKEGKAKENRNTCANDIVSKLTTGTRIEEKGELIKFSANLVEKINMKSVISQFQETLVNVYSKYTNDTSLAITLAEAFVAVPVVETLRKYEPREKNDKLSLS